MTAPLTPKERVKRFSNKVGEGLYIELQQSETGEFVRFADYYRLAAELEEANKKMQDTIDYGVREWKRAEAAERERDAVHAGELAAMEGCDDIPNDYTPNGKLAWLVGSYKTKLHAAEAELSRYREAEKALPEEPHIHHVFLEKPFSGEGVNVPAVLKEDYDKLRAHAIAKIAAKEGK